jgi:hypothetical protein
MLVVASIVGLSSASRRLLWRGKITVVPADFMNDDDGYLAWLAAHPTGYVINCAKDPKPDYVILHRADCSSITGTPSNGGRWTHGGYRKVCAGSKAKLDAWAWDAVGTAPSRCGMCQP